MALSHALRPQDRGDRRLACVGASRVVGMVIFLELAWRAAHRVPHSFLSTDSSGTMEDAAPRFP
jgi:hypothetical protein